MAAAGLPDTRSEDRAGRGESGWLVAATAERLIGPAERAAAML